MLTPSADEVYVHPATADLPERAPQAYPSIRESASTLQRLDAVLWYERELLESLVDAHTRPGRLNDAEIARLTDERRTTSLLRLVESAQLADELGLPAGASDFSARLGSGWASVLTEHETALGRLALQLDGATERAG